MLRTDFQELHSGDLMDKENLLTIISLHIQWNLRIKDNLGAGILSVVRRLVSLGGQPMFSLKMP